mgnify:CR=1 FL=1
MLSLLVVSKLLLAVSKLLLAVSKLLGLVVRSFCGLSLEAF